MSAWIWILTGAVLAFAVVWAKARFAGFTAQRPEDYEDDHPVFDIRRHLNGPIVCEGIIYGPLGRVSSRFRADFNASWDGDTGVMKEHFVYDDGSVQDREWRLTLRPDGAIRAQADDVVGDGLGRQSGSTVLLRYRIRLPEASGGHVLNTTDWMYLTPDGTIMNRSQFRKFGIKVAELVATMRPGSV
ncbi:DUF3833 domain-containing protein [Roseobacter ponti]|uniref:DUF3833 domain-containing protein n=1 Tax=Roseobacter ponti TaxID=1891787 RepID=A0A858SNF7_9RHOB|nr:DUF3833 domain-containing protein [Roseobacter ponti]QJF49980.1 DUF3833 domain-containing protein [Roseobacter ponti]